MYHVIFEGIDSCGKDTLARATAESLEASGRKVVETREPSAELSKWLKETSMSRGPAQAPVNDKEIFDRFESDRNKNRLAVIEPVRHTDTVVIQVRSFLSSIVYNSDERLWQMIYHLRNYGDLGGLGCWPNLWVIIDAHSDLVKERHDERGEVITDGYDIKAIRDRYKYAAQLLHDLGCDVLNVYATNPVHWTVSKVCEYVKKGGTKTRPM